jgi:hypothetical protein
MLRRPTSAGCVKPVLVVLGTIIVFSYSVIALLSQDPVWFLSRAALPDPERIVIRVDGQETRLGPSTPDYDVIVGATRKGLSAFKSWGLGSMGLSEATLREYEKQGVILELYFGQPVDFHLPFNDGRPTALLMPVKGRFGGEGYVFRGKNGKWWAGQLTMRDPQPILDALRASGYIQ